MTLKSYTHSHHEIETTVERLFELIANTNCGRFFPCTPEGEIAPLEYPEARANLDNALSHPEKWRDLGNVERRMSHYHPAHGLCNCGRSVDLSDPLWNACKCGLWYNMSGQEVISPDAYSADPENGESIADIYSGKDEDY